MSAGGRGRDARAAAKMNESGEEMPMAASTAKPIDDLLEFWSAVAKQMAEIRKMANCGRSA